MELDVKDSQAVVLELLLYFDSFVLRQVFDLVGGEATVPQRGVLLNLGVEVFLLCLAIDLSV